MQPKLTAYEKIYSEIEIYNYCNIVAIKFFCLVINILIYNLTYKFRKMKTRTSLIIALAIIATAAGAYYIGSTVTKDKIANDCVLEKAGIKYPDKTIDEKKEIRNNWKDYFKIVDTKIELNTNYKITGGFDAEIVKIKNNSNYKVDKLIILIKYFYKNGAEYPVEFSVENIEPNNIALIEIPKYLRGMKRTINIDYIYSSELSMLYDKKAPTIGADPNFYIYNEYDVDNAKRLR